LLFELCRTLAAVKQQAKLTQLNIVEVEGLD
jgi:hypothetical protein